jgi:hypothetical protein
MINFLPKFEFEYTTVDRILRVILSFTRNLHICQAFSKR